jgi:hypothetical protein
VVAQLVCTGTLVLYEQTVRGRAAWPLVAVVAQLVCTGTLVLYEQTVRGRAASALVLGQFGNKLEELEAGEYPFNWR